ncbi:protein takeout-like [Adelges cooleyi]|uniref:protein takeout-like n=1 Tax=Adelges cooleyi TaxID=133065 RepID=UPI00217FE1A5|nr:protein takeout-like [Adelges cooleyi]
MAFRTVAFVFCTLQLFGEITGRTLPSFIKPCKRNDPNLNECLGNILESLRPFAAKGIPEMHVPPLDPISVPVISLNQGTNSVNFKALFTHLKGFGAKNFELKNIKIDIENHLFEIELHFPEYKIESKYDITGKILMLPIKGNGKFSGNFTNINADVKVILQTEKKKNGKNHFEFKDKNVDLKIGSAHMHFSNLFNGNKEMSDTANRFINEHWRSLMQETRPLFEDTVGAMLVNIFKPVFDMYSVEELLPV